MVKYGVEPEVVCGETIRKGEMGMGKSGKGREWR
jgi:hypothetical protein